MLVNFGDRPLHYQNKNLFLDTVNLTTHVKNYGTPTYFYSEKTLLSRFSSFKSGLKSFNHLICFAVKSNSNHAILKLLGRHGSGADIVSGGELERCLLADIAPQKMVFSGVGKTEEEILFALKENILTFQVESEEELHSVSKIASKLNKKATVSFRFNPNIDAKTHPYISTGLKENKFGITESEIERLISFSVKKSSHLSFEGLSIHIGSQLTTLAPLKEGFKSLARLAQKIESKNDLKLKRLNFGGGLGISYHLKEKSRVSIRQYTNLITQTVHEYGLQNKTILIEPGRSIMGPSGILVSKVLYLKRHGNKQFIILDAAMNDLMRPALYGSHHEIIPLKYLKANSSKADFVGPICESTDALAKNRSIACSFEPGDFVAILDAGAYGSSMSNQYNTRPRPSEVLISKNKSKLIRKRESIKDIFKNEIFL